VDGAEQKSVTRLPIRRSEKTGNNQLEVGEYSTELTEMPLGIVYTD
jgi:hypothetical protein